MMTTNLILLFCSIVFVVNNHHCFGQNNQRKFIAKEEEQKKLRSISSLSLSEHKLDRNLWRHLESFYDWAKIHSKKYKNQEEKIHRFKVWIENHEFIEKHNSYLPKPSFTLGHNHFSDLSQEEFQQMHNLQNSHFNHLMKDHVSLRTTTKSKNLFNQPDDKIDTPLYEETVASHRRKLMSSSMQDLPIHVNWVKAGAVTKVKNQGHCGACWAFSTTGAIEGARFIKTNELLSLSEQNLIDCDVNDNACKGGIMERAFAYDTKGLCSEIDYPYEMEKNSTCNPGNCSPVPDTGVLHYIDVPEKSDAGLRASIAMQPTSIAIDAKSIYFQFYKSGVFHLTDCGKDGLINHGVLAVGYGHDETLDKDYYLIKNSWGEHWGDNGYIRVERNLRHEYGMCAILKVITTPVLE